MDVQAEELDRPAFNATLFLIRSIFDKTGMGADMVFQLKPAFEKAGLADVKVEIKKMPAGKLCGNEVDMRNSLDPFKITIPSIIQGAKGKHQFLRNATFLTAWRVTNMHRRWC